MIWRWLRRLVALALAYFGWGFGFALLEDAWIGAGGPLAFFAALVPPLVAGAAGRWAAGSGRFLPVAALGVVALDTLVAATQGGLSPPPGRDLLFRAVPLVAVLGAILLTSQWRAPRARAPE